MEFHIEWLEKHEITLEAKDKAAAREKIREMRLKDLIKDPSYKVTIPAWLQTAEE